MTIRFEERPQSGSSATNPPGVSKEYVLGGIDDDATARAIAISSTPNVIATTQGLMWRQDCRVMRQGYNLHYVTIPYAQFKHEVGSFRFRFDGSGGMTHLTTSLQTVAAYGSGAAVTDFGNLIGVHGEEVDGVDWPISGSKFTCIFTHPQGWFTPSQAFAVSELRGAVNSTFMFGRPAGEIRFESFSGSEGTDSETSIEYSFAHSKNVTGLTVGTITGIDKDGWDYAWEVRQDAVVSGIPVKQPVRVYIERLGERIDMASVLGFG